MLSKDNFYSSKSIQFEKVDFEPLGKIGVRLLLQDEIKDILGKELNLQIAYCLLKEDGTRLFEDSEADEIKNKMPLAHQTRFIKVLGDVNALSSSIEEIEGK